MGNPYRDNPITAVKRPALRWWQLALELVLTPSDLSFFRWHREHGGGDWIFYETVGWFRPTVRLDDLLRERTPFFPDDYERWPVWESEHG